MPCKTCKKNKHGEIRSKTIDYKSKFACILRASESTRMRMEESLPKCHEDHIAGNGDNPLQHYHLVHKFIPMSQAMKIPAAKIAADKEWEKLEKIPAWGKTKVRNKSDVIDEARIGRKVHFASMDGPLSFEECLIVDKAPKKQRSSCTPKRHRERWFGILCSIHWTRIISITNDSSKRSWRSYPDCQEAQDKQRTQYRLFPRWKWKMLQNCWKFPNRNVQTFGFVYHDTNCQNHGPVWKTQSFLLSEICTVILWQDTYGKGNLRNSYWNGWEKVSNRECLFVHREKGLFLSVYVDDIELAGKKQNINWNKQKYCGQLQSHVWIANFRRSNWKITMLGKSEYLFVVLWHGRSCQEMCATTLWVGKQDDSTTLQSIYSMHRWPPLQRRRNEICWRIVRSMLSNCYKMFVLGTYWKTRYSMVSDQTCTIDHKMDQSLWQTIISLDLLHSSYMWIQTVLSCG